MSRQVYFEHDNRGPSTSVYRQPNAMGRQRKYRDHTRSGKTHNYDAEGDVDMGVGPIDRRYNPYAPQKNHHSRKKYKKQMSHKSNRQSNRNGPIERELNWGRITIPHGRKYGKEFILKSLTSVCKGSFLPVNFQFNGQGAAEFFVNDENTIRILREYNKKISTPQGFKMVIIVQMCAAPPASGLNDNALEILKTSMSARFDTITRYLNLSRFHHDQSIRANGFFLPLHKPAVFAAVAKIIKEHIPELEILDISDNKLNNLEPMSIISPICKQMKVLIMKNNKIRSIIELDFLKGMEVADLILDGNPLCDAFRDKNTYISAVRDRFPKLVNLDGHALPATISFDLGPEKCPESKKSFFAADDVKDMVIQFLDQYYTIYDSGDRTKLLDAYHEQACFSLCLSKNRMPPPPALAAYNFDNRNLLRVSDPAIRFKLLKQGRMSIVTSLSELPQTMHDPSSFSVDIFHVSPGLMSFSVIGVFKEVGAEINNALLKSFSRTFVVVAQGQGFAITNETLYICIASSDQESKAFKVPAPTPSPSPAPAIEEVSAHEKQLRVIELSKQTNMNLDFSTKCLEENDWDFTRAFAVFLDFQSKGKLPPEAFLSM